MATLTPPKKDKNKQSKKQQQQQEEEVIDSPAAVAAKYKMRQRFEKSGYFLGALLLHLILFIMLATFVLFHMQAPPPEVKFLPVAIKPPPPPPVPPPPPGGDAANAEPDVNITPPPMMPSIITTDTAMPVNVTSVKVPVPNMDLTLSTHESGQKAGHGSGRGGHGFGSVGEESGLLVGYLFDLKQDRNRKPTGMDSGKYHDVIKQFIAQNWDASILTKYYKSPKALSTAYIFIPTLKAEDGPQAFGVQAEVKPNQYIIWYKATVSPTQDGTYHFVGVADDILAIRVNGQTVLDGVGGAVGPVWDGASHLDHYHMTNFNATCGPDGDFAISDPIHARAGDKIDVDIIMGEQPGGRSNYFIYMQRDEDLSSYQKQSNGSPLLPIFQLDNDPIKPEGEAESFPPFSPTPNPWKGLDGPNKW